MFFKSFEKIYECKNEKDHIIYDDFDNHKIITNNTIHEFQQKKTSFNTEHSEDCVFLQSYFINIIKLVTIHYFIYVCTLCSIIFELAAQIDRLITISFRSGVVSRIWFVPSYKATSFFIFLASAIGYTYKFFFNTVTKNNASTEIYRIAYNWSNETYKLLELIQTTIRDILCVVLLLILNIIILIVFKRIMVRKKKIMSIVSNRRQNKLSISKFQILRFLLSLYNFNLLNCINFILKKRRAKFSISSKHRER